MSKILRHFFLNHRSTQVNYNYGWGQQLFFQYKISVPDWTNNVAIKIQKKSKGEKDLH